MDTNETEQAAAPPGQLHCSMITTDLTRTEWNPKLPLVKLQPAKGGSNPEGAGPVAILQLSITDPAILRALSTTGRGWAITLTPTEGVAGRRGHTREGCGLAR